LQKKHTKKLDNLIDSEASCTALANALRRYSIVAKRVQRSEASKW